MAPEALPKAARTIVASLSLFIASFLVLVFAILSKPMATKKEPRFGRRALSTVNSTDDDNNDGADMLACKLGDELFCSGRMYKREPDQPTQ